VVKENCPYLKNGKTVLKKLQTKIQSHYDRIHEITYKQYFFFTRVLIALKCKLYNQKKNSSGYANPFININGIQSHIHSIKKYLTQETLNVDGRIEPKHS
jgi:hypothetical protein